MTTKQQVLTALFSGKWDDYLAALPPNAAGWRWLGDVDLATAATLCGGVIASGPAKGVSPHLTGLYLSPEWRPGPITQLPNRVERLMNPAMGEEYKPTQKPGIIDLSATWTDLLLGGSVVLTSLALWGMFISVLVRLFSAN